MKQIWAELPKHMSTPVAPLDEEMLSELAKVPAVVEGRDSLLFFLVVIGNYSYSHNHGSGKWGPGVLEDVFSLQMGYFPLP